MKGEIAVHLGISQERVGHIIDGILHAAAEMKVSRVKICLQHYKNKDEEFLHIILTTNEIGVPHCEPKTKHQPMEYHHKGSHVKKIKK